MSGVNKAIIVGNLGNDPKIRTTQAGAKVAELSVASTDTWRDKTTNERKQVTDWHRVVIFVEGLAEVAEKYAKKGSKVYVEGQMKTRKWTDRAGVERYTTEIVLNGRSSQFHLLDRREGVAPAESADDYGSDAPPPDNEIPFA